jgi:quinol monooxygenase YgiN
MPTSALPLAFVAKLVAKDDTAAELGDLLTGALQLANEEAGTVVWFALRTDPTTFWIVDAFPSEDARQAHLGGRIAAALMANADRLLASPPEILPADVLAAKVP